MQNTYGGRDAELHRRSVAGQGRIWRRPENIAARAAELRERAEAALELAAIREERGQLEQAAELRSTAARNFHAAYCEESLMSYPPTTDTDRITDAIDTLRDLRSRATNHYDTLNNWLIIDTLTDVITLLQDAEPVAPDPFDWPLCPLCACPINECHRDGCCALKQEA
jgi:hypothetical protein